MPVRTEIELASRLDREIAWRKHELTLLNLGVHEERVGAAAIRAGICLLYAHWEGFIKIAATSYLEFVAGRRLRYDELRMNFLAIGMRRDFRHAMGQRDVAVYARLVERIHSAGQRRLTLPVDDAIETKANLDSKVFRDILLTIGFSTDGYTMKEQMLDVRLLRNRNKISHGEPLDIAAPEYVELHGAVIELMDRFKSDIEAAASSKKYRAYGEADGV